VGAPRSHLLLLIWATARNTVFHDRESNLDYIWRGVFIGLLATALIDLWAVVLWAVFKQPLANWAFVGRWAGHAAKLTFFHNSIKDAAPIRSEYLLGWLFHYGTGAIFGATFACLVGADWFNDPHAVPGWAFGVLTVGFAWFLLQPGMGAGWAASKTPRPWKVRFLGLVSHSIFGLGLWLGALLLLPLSMS